VEEELEYEDIKVMDIFGMKKILNERNELAN
jgi:hypothetical protein